MSHQALLFVSKCAKLSVGFALIVSATQHLLHGYFFAFSIAGYQLLSPQLLEFAPYFMGSLMFVVGALVLVEKSPSILWIAASIFLILAVAQAQALFRGISISCGCFGYSTHQISLSTLAIPTSLFVCCVFALIYDDKQSVFSILALGDRKSVETR